MGIHDYRVSLGVAEILPEGRLAHMSWVPERFGRGWRVRMMYRTGHMAEPLMHDLGELLRAMSRGFLICDPDRANDPPDWDIQWERVPTERMPLASMAMRRETNASGRELYVCRVRADMISAALCREINNTMPEYAGILRYRTTATVAQTGAADAAYWNDHQEGHA